MHNGKESHTTLSLEVMEIGDIGAMLDDEGAEIFVMVNCRLYNDIYVNQLKTDYLYMLPKIRLRTFAKSLVNSWNA